MSSTTQLSGAIDALILAAGNGSLASSEVTEESLDSLVDHLYGARAARHRLALQRCFTRKVTIDIRAERAFTDDDSLQFDVGMTLSSPGLIQVRMAVGSSGVTRGDISSKQCEEWGQALDADGRAAPGPALTRITLLARRFIAANSHDFKHASLLVSTIEVTGLAPSAANTAAEAERTLTGTLDMRPGDGAFDFYLTDSGSGHTVRCDISERDVPAAAELANRVADLTGMVKYKGGAPVSIVVRVVAAHVAAKAA